MYKVTNNLLGKITSTPLPSAYPTDQLPQVVSDFLVYKVRQIRDSIDSQVVYPPSHSLRERHFSGTPMCGFESVTNETVLKFMKQVSPKTCVLDPISTSLLFECSNEIVPRLTAIVKQSLSTVIFPSCMKAAIVKPLLKKTSLVPNVLSKNFRPVSNLSFVSKLIENIVLDQLLSHLDQNSLWPTFQSAYRPKHSTETALLRVY